MDNGTFIKEIYEPYNESYKLIKMIKDCRTDDSEDTWRSFSDAMQEFTKRHDTDIGHALARMITDVADSIAYMNGKED